ncbi:hypothetical protein ACCD05_29050, partial [Rhizobium sp. Rhizsp42]
AMIQSSACQPWHVDPPGLAGEHGGLFGTYTISWDTIIEMAFSKLKALLRKMKARTYDDLWKAVGKVCDLFTPQECWNYFRQAGCVAH